MPFPVKHYVTVAGKQVSIAEAAKLTGINKHTLYNRHARGYRGEELLKPRFCRHKASDKRLESLKITIDGVKALKREHCARRGSKVGTIYSRVKRRGVTFEEALNMEGYTFWTDDEVRKLEAALEKHANRPRKSFYIWSRLFPYRTHTAVAEKIARLRRQRKAAAKAL